VQGQADGPVLTAKGRRQAAQAAERLRARRVSALYTSDLERARQTAAIVGTALGLAQQSDAALRERDFGVAQGHPLDELVTEQSGIEGERVVDVDARPPDGESLRAMYQRVGTFIDMVRADAPEGDVVVVTHGGVIRIAQAYGSGMEPEAMTWGPVPNASVWSLSRTHPAVAVVQ
jgi:probable phosphoglycerate mutase